MSKESTGGSDSTESACAAGDLGSTPGLGRSPAGGHGNPLQYSSLENLGVAKNRIGLSDKHSHFFKESTRVEQNPYRWQKGAELQVYFSLAPFWINGKSRNITGKFIHSFTQCLLPTDFVKEDIPQRDSLIKRKTQGMFPWQQRVAGM